MWIEINMTINRSQRVMIRKRRARINHRSREAWVQGPAEIDYGIEQSASTLAGREGPVLVINKPAWSSVPSTRSILCRASWMAYAFAPLLISWFLLRPR